MVREMKQTFTINSINLEEKKCGPFTFLFFYNESVNKEISQNKKSLSMFVDIRPS